MESDLLEKLAGRQISKIQLLREVEDNLGLVPLLLEGTFSAKAAVRYGCGSVLADLCDKHPDKLYPFVDKFIALLDSKHRILTWNALASIANLTVVDIDRKFDAIFDKYYGFLGNEYMVTVTNVIANSAKIASNKPYLVDKIIAELLKTQSLHTTPHLTEECKLVIAQHAIETFNTLICYTQNKQPLIDYTKNHQNSIRISLKKEANSFLNKWQ